MNGLKPYKETGRFRFWCQKVLPQVYDDSLSYYEVLNKVVTYLNDVIENLDTVEENVDLLAETVSDLPDIKTDVAELKLDVSNLTTTLDQVSRKTNKTADDLQELSDMLYDENGLIDKVNDISEQVSNLIASVETLDYRTEILDIYQIAYDGKFQLYAEISDDGLHRAIGWEPIGEYSTDEERVGVWIDGSIIYEKTIKIDAADLPSSDTTLYPYSYFIPQGGTTVTTGYYEKYYSLSSLNIKDIIKVDAIAAAYTSSDPVFKPFLLNGESVSNGCPFGVIYANRIGIRLPQYNTNYDYIVITIRYTKTS